MPVDLPDLRKNHKTVGGIYWVQTSEMKEKGAYKIGMSQSNIYKRLDSLQLMVPWGYDIVGLFLQINKSRQDKENIRATEKWIHQQLSSAKLTTRIFKDRIEVFTDTYERILEVFQLAQAKFEHLSFTNNLEEPLNTDDKQYEVVSILGDKKDELGREQFEVLWGDGTKTWEFRSSLVGVDSRGKFIVAAFAQYLKKKKSPRRRTRSRAPELASE